MNKIHLAGRIFGGVLITVGVVGILGTAGGSDQGTMSLGMTALYAIASFCLIGLGWLINKLNSPLAIRRRAAYRFRRDVDLIDDVMAQVWEQRHGDWFDQIPVDGNCRQTNIRPIRPISR